MPRRDRSWRATERSASGSMAKVETLWATSATVRPEPWFWVSPRVATSRIEIIPVTRPLVMTGIEISGRMDSTFRTAASSGVEAFKAVGTADIIDRTGMPTVCSRWRSRLAWRVSAEEAGRMNMAMTISHRPLERSWLVIIM